MKDGPASRARGRSRGPFLFFGLGVALAAFPLLSLASCASGPAIQTFFVDAGVQQYFIYPSELRGRGCEAIADFTYRSSENFVVCNVSISTADGVSRDCSGLTFALDGGRTAVVGDPEILAINRREKEIRLSGRLALEDFKALASSSGVDMSFSMNGKRYTVRGGSYFMVQMKAAREELFEHD